LFPIHPFSPSRFGLGEPWERTPCAIGGKKRYKYGTSRRCSGYDPFRTACARWPGFAKLPARSRASTQLNRVRGPLRRVTERNKSWQLPRQPRRFDLAIPVTCGGEDRIAASP
jgi:hypothetical protein